MQRERIYSAPSLVEVIKQLLIYRSTGVLTFWRATASRQEQVMITIEQGRPLRVFWGSTRQENINESILHWLNTWGEIHFSFLASDPRLQLPSPASHVQQPTQQPPRVGQPPRRTAVTRPLSTLPPTPGNTNSLMRTTSSIPVPRNGRGHPETIVAFLTPGGQQFPAANLPRYERTIFLLINGRRTLVDIAQLTNRSPNEVYATLSHLQNLQLITIETLPTPHKP
ncbi:MAG TPA: hypothetical protein VEV19_01815 [Ktedonobacteraceae bacterium]|nr:hypothetical protein [Ktedonobacteraceae bacterium]